MALLCWMKVDLIRILINLRVTFKDWKQFYVLLLGHLKYLREFFILINHEGT